MRVMHGRPAPGVGTAVGKRVLGSLGAVALTVGLLSACDGGEQPPVDTPATSSPSPEESAPSPGPSAEEPEPEASASEPSSEPSGDGADEGAGEDAGDGTAKPGEDEGDESSEPGDGTSQGEGKPEGKGGDKDPKEEPEKPDYIEYGEVSARVGKLQQRLKDLGYFVTSVDKAYGGETQQAIFALQKAGGLYRDGVVGDATQNAADDGVVPKAQTSSGKVLEIDVDRQLVLAVENGKVVKIINASSGNGETYEAKGATYTAYTPRGSFAVFREVNGMHSSTLELGDMWRPKFFTGGIAVHGSASVPAFPASHGCVRVSNSAMDWIWDTWGAPSGTPVVVY
ncbi:L,D-transpeptidase family protein [Promicromonospora sp. NPDC050249]|uniref:L,D-transpeptidase family protein n=1 Tax=Promicromonospora sp. NPDC050249 TaxID=3154743 RepID=UPI0033D55E9B